MHQIDEIQGLLRSCWSNSGFLGIWVRVWQAGTDADGFDCRNDWLDLCWSGRIAGHSRSIDGVQRERKGGEALWCSPQSTRAQGGSGSSISHRYRPSIRHHQASSRLEELRLIPRSGWLILIWAPQCPTFNRSIRLQQYKRSVNISHLLFI